MKIRPLPCLAAGAALLSLVVGLMPVDAADKPLLAVAPFVNAAGDGVDAWWAAGGADKTLSAACAELEKSPKLRCAPAGTAAEMSAAAHVDLGKPLTRQDLIALGKANKEVKYLVLGSLKAYAVRPIGGNVGMLATINATMLNVRNGESVWTDEANHHSSMTAPAGGVSAGVYDQMFDKVIRPVVVELVADIDSTENI